MNLPKSPDAPRSNGLHTQFRFSRDGRTLVIRRDHDLVVTSTAPGGLNLQLVAKVDRFDLSPDGRWLATFTHNFSTEVEIRDLRNPKALMNFEVLLIGIALPTALAFSPDGRFLITTSSDGTALVWDMRPIYEKATCPPTAPDQKQLDAWWAGLRDDDGEKVGAAMTDFETRPAEAVPFLASKLKPVPAPAPGRIARLIPDLDCEEFDVRQQATKELEAFAEVAEPELRAALKGKPSPELKKAAERLLGRIDALADDPDWLRQLRAVEILERLGTAEARKALEGLARGAPAARLTREAKASLERLAGR